MTAPALAVTQPDGSRMYVHPLTGEKVPSVTTVIDMIAKPALIGWAAKMAAQHAVANWARLSGLPVQERIDEIRGAHQQYADKKADLGDRVHELIDAWSRGVPHEEAGRDADPYVNSFIAFMSAKRPVFAGNEVTVWSRRHGYAGTADWIARIDGKMVLGDNKTGRRLYPEVGLQLAALAAADFIITPDGAEHPMPELDGVAALHIRPRSWKLVPVTERKACFEAFLAARRLIDWDRETAPVLLGG